MEKFKGLSLGPEEIKQLKNILTNKTKIHEKTNCRSKLENESATQQGCTLLQAIVTTPISLQDYQFAVLRFLSLPGNGDRYHSA
jgi:hypothetical protein